MKLYSRLAAEGIRKNRRLYTPYLITCVAMVAIHYMLCFLNASERVQEIPGGGSLGVILGLGSYVVSFFSALFLFYTNSFLIRRRKREFGLYNVLGMGKRELRRIMTWEALFSALLSLVLGLALGVLTSKLAELGLLKLMGAEAGFSFRIAPAALRRTALAYCLIFALIWISSLLRVSRSTAVSLLKSENVGEKPPRANWVLGLLGVLVLGSAYYLAVTIENPMSAIIYFFIAVLMVIAATYLLLIAGSVLLCRILQKNPRYYYQKRNFVAVSSMAYRMKRNGAGLASVCILATMILVMISSTSCLYFGAEDTLRTNYPRELNLSFRMNTLSQLEDSNTQLFLDTIEQAVAAQGLTMEELYVSSSASVAGLLMNGEVELDYRTVDDSMDFDSLRLFRFVTPEAYRRESGEELALPAGQVALRTSGCSYSDDMLRFRGCGDLSVCDSRREAWQFSGSLTTIPTITVVTDSLDEIVALFQHINTDTRMNLLELEWVCAFDVGGSRETQIACANACENAIASMTFAEAPGYEFFTLDCRAQSADDFYGSYGGLFFLGIILSLVFILAAVLILYYKQISEGYEDQSRFQIMQKVGMTKPEIRRSVDSQLLMVFFLPLGMAGLHMLFAFPMIRKLLLLFGLTNVGLFALTTAISFAAFTLCYVLIYRITSRTYVSIVSGAGHE